MDKKAFAALLIYLISINLAIMLSLKFATQAQELIDFILVVLGINFVTVITMSGLGIALGFHKDGD